MSKNHGAFAGFWTQLQQIYTPSRCYEGQLETWWVKFRKTKALKSLTLHAQNSTQYIGHTALKKDWIRTKLFRE